MNKKRILITGGAGFIGSHLAAAFVDDGHDVIVIDNLSAGCKENLPDGTEFVKADLRDGVPSVLNGRIDVVFHLVAQINARESFSDPVADAKTNIVGGLQLLEALSEVNIGRLVTFSSGGAIYDPSGEMPFFESSPVAPQTPYGLAKLTLEKYHDLLADKLPDYTILRPSNVYGPRQGWGKENTGVVAIFINQLLADKPLTIYGDGSQTRDFVYVQDVVRAAKTVFSEGIDGVFNVSTGRPTSVKTIAETLIDIAGSGKVDYNEAIAGEVKESCLSSEQLQSQSTWQPQTAIKKGLKKTFSFAKNHAN